MNNLFWLKIFEIWYYGIFIEIVKVFELKRLFFINSIYVIDSFLYIF